jgi:hypothetical protein
MTRIAGDTAATRRPLGMSAAPPAPGVGPADRNTWLPVCSLQETILPYKSAFRLCVCVSDHSRGDDPVVLFTINVRLTTTTFETGGHTALILSVC